ESIDTAIKFARCVNKRKGCISAIDAYHGHTGFALATGNPSFKDPFLWNLPEFKQVPFGDAEAMRKVVNKEVSSVILETIPATGGVLIAPEGYFSEVREICDENGALLIIDEVQAGLGRTGEFWGIYGGLYPNEKVVPDFVVCGKGMSSGIYPLSTCSYKPFVEEVFKDDPFIHISTTGGSDLACAVACEMLDIQSDPKFLSNVKEMGKMFGNGLKQITEENSELIKDVRGRGLMWGMEFYSKEKAMLGMVSIIKEGVLNNYCGNKEDTLILMPPLIVNKDDVKEIIERISKGVETLKKLK
ncbi:MAG TPA: aminotransferase class III-fold pyridoxal phosphate-dependent enzyme, partial [Candidatus Lokiarchaeia archaeon]